jgi:hypothetical protein
MYQEFEGFLKVWQKVMNAKGGISLPARKDITVRDFAEWLPSMLIVKWDFDVPEREVVYAGSEIDELFALDVKSTSLQTYFPDADELKTHVEAARHVVTELVGQEGVSALKLRDGREAEYAHIRLPLAPEDGMPVMVSVFKSVNTEPVDESDCQHIATNPHIITKRIDYIPLFDDE